MGQAYRAMLADRELLLSQMQLYAACSDPEIRQVAREGFEWLWRGDRPAVGSERAAVAGLHRHRHAAERRRVDGLPGDRRQHQLVSAARVGYLGLGSNVGDRRANLQAALDGLGRARGRRARLLLDLRHRPGRRDPRPAGLPECRLRIETALGPIELLDALQGAGARARPARRAASATVRG